MEVGELYQAVFRCCVQFVTHNAKNIREKVEDLLPLLKSFSDVFLKENEYGIEEEEYVLLKQLYIEILMDIQQGMEQRDTVLLADTVEFGLKEFLEMFIPDEQELMALRRACINES